MTTETSTSCGIFRVLLELPGDASHQRLGLDRPVVVVLPEFDANLEVVLGPHESSDDGPGQPLDEHLHRPVRQPEKLQDAHDRADPVEVIGLRLVRLHIALRHDEHDLVAVHHFLERRDRARPAHEQRHDHAREENEVSEGHDRQLIAELDCLVVVLYAKHLFSRVISLSCPRDGSELASHGLTLIGCHATAGRRSRVPPMPNITPARIPRNPTRPRRPTLPYFFSTSSLRVITWSMMPYSRASSGDMKKFRSVSFRTFSTSWPVWFAMIVFSCSRISTISLA